MEGHYTFMNNPEFLAFSEFSNVTFVNHLTGQQKSVTVPDLTCDTPIYIESIPDFGLKSFPEMVVSCKNSRSAATVFISGLIWNSNSTILSISLDNVMKTDYPGVSNLANYKKLISLVKDGYITDYHGIVISKISSNILSKECAVLTGSYGRIYSFCFNENCRIKINSKFEITLTSF